MIKQIPDLTVIHGKKAGHIISTYCYIWPIHKTAIDTSSRPIVMIRVRSLRDNDKVQDIDVLKRRVLMQYKLVFSTHGYIKLENSGEKSTTDYV